MATPKDELLYRDAGDSLYAAAPRGSHGTLVFIRPGDGEMYLPTAAVDALRAALAATSPSPTFRPLPPRTKVSADPAHYLTAAELAEARDLYERLCIRIRTNVGGRPRHHPAGTALPHLQDVRRQVTASRRSGTASDADVGELHREWTNIARLASQETTAGPELTYRLAALAAQMIAAYDTAVRGAR